MDLEKLLENEKLCITEEPSACIAKCPLHVDIKGMMDETSQGRFDKAYKILSKKLPFPKVLSRICDCVCEEVCLRKDLGGAVSIHEIEKAIVKYGAGKPMRILPIPKNGNKVAVIGGGLSGLTAAVDLEKKGYSVAIFEKENKLGGRMWSFTEDVLPYNIINEELDQINKSDIEIKINSEITMEEINRLSNEFDAVYVGIGKKVFDNVDMNTFQTDNPKIFTGGIGVLNNDSIISSVSSGRRAAVSIDRFVQKKSLTAVREKEGSYDTTLKLNLEDIEASSRVEGELSREEAIAEASRCIKCQCLECLKACSHIKRFETLPKNYIRKIRHNEEIIMGDHYANKMINSCNMCGLCSKVCPSGFNMRDIILNTRKSMVERNKMPASAHDFAIKDMIFSNSDKPFLLRHQKGFNKSRYLFFPGCQLSASAPEYVEEIYKYIISKTNEGTGVMLGCCGAPAEWAGREELFNKTLENIKEKWHEMGDPTLILACISCWRNFEKYLPDIKYISIWDFMDENGIPENKKIKDKRIFALHDTCSARYNKDVQDITRKVIRHLGHEIEELKYSKEKTKCCGYGGLAYYANKEQTDEAIKERTHESSRDYVVYCAMCRDLFASKDKRTLQIFDLLFSENLDESMTKKPPRIWERRINRLNTKKRILKLLGEEMDNVNNLKLNIILSDEIKDVLEDRWILLQDIEQVIENAEKTEEKFKNPDTGHLLARKRLDNVTYWVEYEKINESYIVHNAYSHRMEVVED